MENKIEISKSNSVNIEEEEEEDSNRSDDENLNDEARKIRDKWLNATQKHDPQFRGNSEGNGRSKCPCVKIFCCCRRQNATESRNFHPKFDSDANSESELELVSETRSKFTRRSCLFASCCWLYSHPLVRITFISLALALDFLMLYEDPLTYSNSLVELPVVGTAFNHFTKGYPKDENNGSWFTLKLTSMIFITLTFVLLGEIFVRRMILKNIFKLKMSKNAIFVICATFFNFVLGLYLSALFYIWSIDYKPLVESNWMRKPTEPRSSDLGPNDKESVFSRCGGLEYDSSSRTDLLKTIPTNELSMYNSTFGLLVFYAVFLANSYTFFSICDSTLQDNRKYPEYCKRLKKNCWSKWRIFLFWIFIFAVVACAIADGCITFERNGEGGGTYWQGKDKRDVAKNPPDLKNPPSQNISMEPNVSSNTTTSKKSSTVKQKLKNVKIRDSTASKHCSRLIESSSELLKIRNWYCHAVFKILQEPKNATPKFDGTLWFVSAVTLKNQQSPNFLETIVYDYRPMLEEVAVSRIERGESLKNFEENEWNSDGNISFEFLKSEDDDDEDDEYEKWRELKRSSDYSLEPILPTHFISESGKETETELPVSSRRGIFGLDETWRIAMCVAVLVLNVLILTQEADFPHFGKRVPNETETDEREIFESESEIKIPGWHSDRLEFSCFFEFCSKQSRTCKRERHRNPTINFCKWWASSFARNNPSIKTLWNCFCKDKTKNQRRKTESNICACCCKSKFENDGPTNLLEDLEEFSEICSSSSENSDLFSNVELSVVEKKEPSKNSKETSKSLAGPKNSKTNRGKPKKSLITARSLIYLSMTFVIVFNCLSIYAQFSYDPEDSGHVVDFSNVLHPTIFKEYLDVFEHNFDFTTSNKNLTLESRPKHTGTHYESFHYHSLELMCPTSGDTEKETNIEWFYKRISAATNIPLKTFVSKQRTYYSQKIKTNSAKSNDEDPRWYKMFEENQKILWNWKISQVKSGVPSNHTKYDSDDGTLFGFFASFDETFTMSAVGDSKNHSTSNQQQEGFQESSSKSHNVRGVPIIWDHHQTISLEHSNPENNPLDYKYLQKLTNRSSNDNDKMTTHVFKGRFCECGFKYLLDLEEGYQKNFQSTFFDSNKIPDYFTKISSDVDGTVGLCNLEESDSSEDQKDDMKSPSTKVKKSEDRTMETNSKNILCRDNVEYSLVLEQRDLDSIEKFFHNDDVSKNTKIQTPLDIVNKVLWFLDNDNAPSQTTTSNQVDDVDERCARCFLAGDYYRNWKHMRPNIKNYFQKEQINLKGVNLYLGRKFAFTKFTQNFSAENLKIGIELTANCEPIRIDFEPKPVSKMISRGCVLTAGPLNIKYVGASTFWKLICLIPGCVALFYLIFRLALFHSYRSLYVWHLKRKEKNKTFEVSERRRLGCLKKCNFKARFCMLKTCFCIRCKKPPRRYHTM